MTPFMDKPVAGRQSFIEIRRLAGLGLATACSLGAGTAAAGQALPLSSMTIIGTAAGDFNEQLQLEQVRDVREVLDRSANIDIGGGVRQGQRLYLRGIEGSNLNITVDGARQGQNLYNHRGGLGNIDPDLLKQVDVRPGPAAADEGPGAIGGSIRMQTVDAQDLLAAGRQMGARIRAGYASASRSERASASAYGLLAPGVGLLAHLSRDDFDDLRIGGGQRTPFSGGQDDSYMIKLSVLDQGAHSVRLGTERHKATGLNFQQRGDYPWQFQPDPEGRPPRDQTQIREQHTLGYRYNPSQTWLDTEVSLYQAENSWRGLTPPPNNFTEGFTSKGWGGDLRNNLGYAMADWEGSLVVGVDYYEDKGTNSRSDRPDRRNQQENLGWYMQNRMNSKATDIWFGVRRDEFDVSYRNGTTQADNHATSFNLGIEQRLGRHWAVFAGYGEAANGASTIPVHFAGNVVENALINGSTNGRLKAERSAQTEVGVRWQDVGGAGGSHRYVELLGFENRIRDAILYDQPGSGGLGGRPVTELFNADQTATFKGYEARAGYALGRWRSEASFMSLQTANLPSQPQFLVRFGAPQGKRLSGRVHYGLTDSLEAGYGLTAVARLKNVPSDQSVFIEKSGYMVHDLFLNWQPPAMQQVSVDFAVRNLLDKKYSRHATLSENGLSTYEAGRDIRVGLRYVF